MEIKQLIVLATVAMMIVMAAKIGLAQIAEVIQRLGRGGPPPTHPLPGNDSVMLLRRRSKKRFCDFS